ncbi:MAG TPA: PQQ-dependent sugar dehydrogenase, partial [Wenzhouxiangellaceae bacterium]|nr:PQQ-dependent sugar dehydrogenase [Wenzhouxiangellaceae bacterium]
MKTLLVVALALLSTATPAQVPDDVSLEPVPGVTGLSAPLGLKHADDGSGRIFIVEQGGTVRVIDSAGNLLADRFVDISGLVLSGGERGLLDIAFHPGYASPGDDGQGLFYLHYSNIEGCDLDNPNLSVPPCGDTVVAEFSVSADPNVASNTPERIILTVSQDFSNHNGGQMRFGADGYLYLGLGDGGSANDPCNRAQTLDPELIETSGSCKNDPSAALLGKMLRIDVDAPTLAGTNNLCAAAGDGSAEYAIPPDNPFAGMDNRCGEVLHYGLRNP